MSTLVPLVVSYMDFADIISSANFLYSLGMLLEFASFLWMRRKLLEVKRPFSIPIGFLGLIVMCLIPSVFLVYVMVVATKPILLINGLLTLFGIAWDFFMNLCRSKICFEFNKGEEQLDNSDM